MPIDPTGMLSDEEYIRKRTEFDIAQTVEAVRRDEALIIFETLRRYGGYFMPVFNGYFRKLNLEQKEILDKLFYHKGDVKAVALSSGYLEEKVEEELVRFLSFMRVNSKALRKELSSLLGGIK